MLSSAVGYAQAMAPIPGIRVDQVGYRPEDAKQAVMAGAGGVFELVDAADGARVFSATATGPFQDASSGDTVYHADFSAFQTPGRYILRTSAAGSSPIFEISQGVYAPVKDAVLKGLYYQRCGTALGKEFAGAWSHGACHLAEGIVAGAGTARDGSGGWHDAGDYGKYSVAGAVAVADLLLACELFPRAFGDSSGIPESGNGVPDVLDECRYELEWLLKMQEAASGGVYHKLTTAGFPGMNVMPEADAGRLIFSPISTAATADLSAVMAMAARAYKSFDAEFSSACLSSSRRAWAWLRGNPSPSGFKNPAGVSTGEYGDASDTDERYWAAAELLRATGETEFQKYLTAVFEAGKAPTWSFGWQNIGGLGSVAYILADQAGTDPVQRSRLISSMIAQCDTSLRVREKDGYRIPLRGQQYGWGSNMTLLNQSMFFILADRLGPRAEYRDAALDCVHYLLGRNSLDQCFVTGQGSRPIRHPHHRPSVADGVPDPVPGLVSGGPDRYLEDPYAQANLKGLPPAKCFADVSDSYSTNEIAIYWNAPAVFVLAWLDGGG